MRAANLAKVVIEDDSGFPGIAGEFCNVHEGLGGNGGPGGDSCCGQKMLLNQVNPPYKQVDIPDWASSHPAIHLYESGPSGSVFTLHMEYPLSNTLPLSAD